MGRDERSEFQKFLYQEQILIMHLLRRILLMVEWVSKVWIMKGEVYGREIFLHLLEWTRNKLAEKVEIPSWKSTLIKVENQTLVKENFKLKKMLQPKENTERYKR
jgi:hypothetical protein